MAHRQNSIHDWFSERKINTAAKEPQLCLVNTQRATEFATTFWQSSTTKPKAGRPMTLKRTIAVGILVFAVLGDACIRWHA